MDEDPEEEPVLEFGTKFNTTSVLLDLTALMFSASPRTRKAETGRLRP